MRDERSPLKVARVVINDLRESFGGACKRTEELSLSIWLFSLLMVADGCGWLVAEKERRGWSNVVDMGGRWKEKEKEKEKEREMSIMKRRLMY